MERLSESALDEVEQQLEADVYRSLSSVDGAIQDELDALFAANNTSAPQGTLRFRQLVLRVINANNSDTRLRKLCAMEPQYALYVLQTLRAINHAPQQHHSAPTLLSAAASSQRCDSPDNQCVEEQHTERLASCSFDSTATVRKRHRMRSDSLLERTVEPRHTRQHRRAVSDSHNILTASRSSSSSPSSSATRSCSADVSIPVSFSLFISSALGISYPLRTTLGQSFLQPTVSCDVTSVSLSGRSLFVRCCLRSATSVHILLASLLYLSLLHTTDSACLRKSQFALAVLTHPCFTADRPLLPLSHPNSTERARRVVGRERQHCRELHYLIDSCCLALIQHDMLPALPFATFDEQTLPPLPIAHSLGLR